MANKKINQLVLKTTIQPTDLFPLGDASTGQLFKKTVAELQAAIGGAVISVNGLVGTVVLDTDDIQELASPTNRYFTEARARAAISLTTTGSSGASTYSSSTGVLNVPTYTLAGLGGITASFLSGGTGITYNSGTGVISYSGTVYTDSSIRALFSAGTGISYNSSTGAISYSGTVYTDSSIRALISLTTTGSSGASTYNNTTGVLNVPNYTLAGLGGISLTSLSGSAPITYNSSTGAIGITQANTSTDGYLSATDWNTFNGKQSALTIGNLTEATSSVLTITGGTGAVIGSGTSIQVKQASSTVSGFLSSTDWSTFNNKQGTITLTTTGTSGAATFSAGTLNIPQYQAVLTNPVTGTGTSGHVAYFNGSGSIAGSANHFWDNTNGRLGIGTATPAYKLDVLGVAGELVSIGTSTQKLYFYPDSAGSMLSTGAGQAGQGIYFGHTSNFMFFQTNAVERMRITSAGNVGINTTSISSATGQIVTEIYASQYATLRANGAGTVKGEFTANSQSNWLFIGTTTNHPVLFSTNDTERMRITSSGNVGIGTSTPQSGLGNGLTIDGSTYATLYLQNSGTQRGYFTGYSGGLIINASTGTLALNNGGSNVLIGTTTDNGERLYVSGSIRATGSITANSDVRLKKNIERIENALQKVSEISGYTYNTIYDEDRHAGVIAQEIDKVLPEIVNKGNDGLMGVEYGNISALLIEAIKDLKVQNDSLQARLSALEK